MRFAILSPIYPYRGGIAQFSGMLYTELVKEGHEVKAFNFKRLYPDILFPGKTQYVEAGDRAIEIESVRVLDSVNPVSYFSTVNAIRSYAPDAVLNVALPYQDLTIMDACLAAGVHYIDTANYEAENTDDPEWRKGY